MLPLHDYAGCIHFHSSYSYDAYRSPEAIIQSALRAGLDYAILTDHFSLQARDDGWEKVHQANGKSLLFLVGEELSPRYNHYLALNLIKPVIVSKTLLDAQEMIDAVSAQGGFGFIAHPFHGGSTFVGVRAYPWVSWEVKGFAGMSIWDLVGDWTSALGSPWGVLKAALSPIRVLRGPHPAALQRWDELAAQGHIAAIGEVDNHGNVKTFLGFSKRIFDFDFAFRTVRTHVLLEQPLSGKLEADRAAVLTALRKGQSYISLDYWKDPKGFTFEVFDDHQRVHMGGEFQRGGPALLEVKVPPGGRIELIRDGRVIWMESSRSHFQRDVDMPGVYRVQVQQRAAGRWRPWIYSNPIWVR